VLKCVISGYLLKCVISDLVTNAHNSNSNGKGNHGNKAANSNGSNSKGTSDNKATNGNGNDVEVR
jgi:hypothetical protein